MLARTFHRRSKTLDRELATFKEQLRALERQVAPAALVTCTRREGEWLHITVLPATIQAVTSTSNSVQPWRAY